MRIPGRNGPESHGASAASVLDAVEEILRRCRTQVSIKAIRASGPGGQNVNKVATAVQLRFDIRHCTGLEVQARRRLVGIGGSRVTTHGVLVIQAERHRSQLENRREALRELKDLLTKALSIPRRRHQTKPTKSSKEERLRRKKRRSLLKRERNGSELD